VPARPRAGRRRPLDRHHDRRRRQRRDGDRRDARQQPSPPARRAGGPAHGARPAARARPQPAGPRVSAAAKALSMGAADQDELRGEIAEGVLPQLLRRIYVERRTAMLRCVRGDEEQSLRFRGGHIVNAHTNIKEDRLGEMLVRRGLLSEEGLARATEIVIREKRRLGEVLDELGLLDANGLEDAIAIHVHEMLGRLFSWTDGSYALADEPQDAARSDVTLKLSTGELI